MLRMSVERLSTHRTPTECDLASMSGLMPGIDITHSGDAVDLSGGLMATEAAGLHAHRGRIGVLAVAGILIGGTFSLGASEGYSSEPRGIAQTSSYLGTDINTPQRRAIQEQLGKMNCKGPLGNRRIRFDGTNSAGNIVRISGAIAPKRRINVVLRSSFDGDAMQLTPYAAKDAYALGTYCADEPTHIPDMPIAIPRAEVMQ